MSITGKIARVLDRLSGGKLQEANRQYPATMIARWLWHAWRGNRRQALFNALIGLGDVAVSLGSVWAIQHAIDGSCAPGLFQLVSIPTIVGCVGALLIIIAAIATPIAKTQRAREIWFYVMSGGAVLKIVTMEIARIIL